MFIAALFTIARTWKHRCPSADEWIRKQWHVYKMEYYSAIKKNAFESVLMRCMKLETIIQSKVSQKEETPRSLMLEKIEGRRKRGQQSLRCLDGIIYSVDISLSKLQEMGKDREVWHAAAHGVTKSQTWLIDWKHHPWDVCSESLQSYS